MLNEKFEKLKELLKNYESLLVAYSGGVDSTFLLKVATDVLGKDKVLGVTAQSETYPSSEFATSQEIAQQFGFNVKSIVSSELAIPSFAENDPNRCYYCKSELFSKLKEIAVKEGYNYVADGSNVDDLGDYRPGMRACKELGIVSPLKEAGLAKEDIRILSKQLGLPTWNKPSYACLSSRFPYGIKITPERLSMVEAAENFLKELGFKQVRVRYHHDIARIEVPTDDFSMFYNPNTVKAIVDKFRSIGFTYVTLDLQGYRTGSLNEVLPR